MAESKKTKTPLQEGQIKVTLIKSPCGRTKDQIATVEALGLKKIGQSHIHKENPAILGMVFKVKHLVKVESVK